MRLSDVAEIELGSASYDRVGRVNQRPTALMMISKQADANALETMANVRRVMDDLSASFPAGVTYRVPYDTTTFITASISEVVTTLIEATVLVIFVVFVFLQSWRATLIPLVAIPVSVVGAFAGMQLLGFSINTLTLFGLVLAIGIVVDDAIVVVENVERLMDEEGLSPRDATIKAMQQVSGALIAMVLVLCAVFVPVAFLGGLTGQLYRQFAVTIAVSVGISGFVALTLSPALCRLLLRPRDVRPRLMVFRWFNFHFRRLTRGYTSIVQTLMTHAVVTIVLFAGLSLIAYRLLDRVPTGFLPTEDQGFFSAAVLLPDGASLDRTDVVLREVEAFLLDHPAVSNVISLLGQDSLSGGIVSSNAATLFVSLKPFDERPDTNLRVQAVIESVQDRFSDNRDGMVYAFHPPAVQGIGQRAGFQFELQDRSSGDIQDLVEVGDRFLEMAERQPELAGLTGSLRYRAPQLFVDVDRERAKVLGLDLATVYDTLQTYLGRLYINDFNMFGRVWRVYMQAQPAYRDEPSDLQNYYVRNSSGDMLPISSVVQTQFRTGPNLVERFNGFSTIQISGQPGPGYSTGEAMDVLEQVARETLPASFGYEWSGASFQERRAGSQAPLIILFGLIVIYLVLAAQYERWVMPVSVLLVVPFAILGALLAIFARGLPQDIYFQIGLLVLVGLSAKNAILIIEFCAALQREGMTPPKAAMEAARIRFRPILMTSLAFVAGVVPLVLAHGAGAAARHSIGTGVVGGMLASTILAPLFVPLFFVILEHVSARFSSPIEDSADLPEDASVAEGA